MKLLTKNPLFRTISIARFFNFLGASIYNLVFIVFAGSLPNAKLTVGAANLILLVPMIFTIFAGMKADATQNKAKWLIRLGYLQAGLFLIVALLTQQKSLLAFSVVCLINIISDVISDYRGSLQMPILQKNIAQDDLMEAYSFTQFLSLLCSVAGQALGVYLLTISQQNFFLVASVNALAFFLSASLLHLHRKQLTHEPVQIKTSKIPLKEQFASLYGQVQLIFKDQGSGSFLQIIAIVLSINAIAGATIPIFNLSLLSHPFWNLSFGQSLLVLQVSSISGMVLASLTPNDYFAKRSINEICSWAAGLLLLMGLVNLVQLPQILTLTLSFSLSYLAGKINPKINSLLMSQLPADVLGQASGLLSLIFSISIPIGTLLFTGLAVWNLSICWLVYSLIGLLSLFLCFKNR